MLSILDYQSINDGLTSEIVIFNGLNSLYELSFVNKSDLLNKNDNVIVIYNSENEFKAIFPVTENGKWDIFANE